MNAALKVTIEHLVNVSTLLSIDFIGGYLKLLHNFF